MRAKTWEGSECACGRRERTMRSNPLAPEQGGRHAPMPVHQTSGWLDEA